MANLRLSLEIVAATGKAVANIKSFVSTVVSGGKEASAAGNQADAFQGVRRGALTAAAEVKKLGTQVSAVSAQTLRFTSFKPITASTGTAINAPAAVIGAPAINAQNAPTGASANSANRFQNIDPTVARSIKEIEKRLRALAPAAETAKRSTVGGFRAMESGAQSVSRQLALLQRAAVAFYTVRSGARFLADIGNVADEYGLLQARIKLASREGANQLVISRELLKVAQESRAPLGGVVDLYARIAPALRGLGDSDQQIIGLTGTVGKLLAVSGAQGPAAAGALNQLAQALGAGALRGDEFNSINEQTPAIMQAVADGLGVPRAALRKYAEEGKLTTEFVTRALAAQADAIDERFAQLPDTISRSGSAVSNAFSKKLGDINERFGVTALVARGLLGLAENIDVAFGALATTVGTTMALVMLRLGQTAVAARAAAAAHAAERAGLVLKAEALVATAVAENAAAVATLRAAEAAGASAVANGSLAAAQARHSAATATLAATQHTLGLATARAAASVSAAGRVLGFLGGPVGIAITALTALAGWWLTVGKNAETATQKQLRGVAAVNGESLRSLLDGSTPSAAQIKAQGKAVADAEAALDAALRNRRTALGGGGSIFDEINAGQAVGDEDIAAAEQNLKHAQDIFARLTAARAKAGEEAKRLQDEYAASLGTGTEKQQRAAEKALEARLERIKSAISRKQREQGSQLDLDFAAGEIDGRAYLEARAQLASDAIDAQHRAVQLALARGGIGADLRDKLHAELQELNTQLTENDNQLAQDRLAIAERGDAAIAQSTADRLRLEGQETAAAQLELEQAYVSHLQNLREAGVANAQVMADEWKDAQIKAIESDDIARALDKAQAQFNQRRDTLDAQVTVGDLSQSQGTARLRAAQREYLDAVQAIESRILSAPDLIPAEKLATFRDAIGQIKTELGALGDPLRDFKVTADSALRDGLVENFKAVSLQTKSVGEGFRDLGRTIVDALQNTAIKKAVDGLVDYIGAAFASLATAQGGNSFLGTLVSLGSTAVASAFGGGAANSGGGGSFFTASSASNGAGGFSFKDGGLITGPGTETSDSIPAIGPFGKLYRLSNLEGILNARTVRRIGGGAALDALNSGRGEVVGLARGGLVGGGSSSGSAAITSADVKIEIINSGAPIKATSTDTSDPRRLKVFVEQVKAAVAADVRGGGMVRDAITSTLGGNAAYGAVRR